MNANRLKLQLTSREIADPKSDDSEISSVLVVIIIGL